MKTATTFSRVSLALALAWSVTLRTVTAADPTNSVRGSVLVELSEVKTNDFFTITVSLGTNYVTRKVSAKTLMDAVLTYGGTAAHVRTNSAVGVTFTGGAGVTYNGSGGDGGWITYTDDETFTLSNVWTGAVFTFDKTGHLQASTLAATLETTNKIVIHKGGVETWELYADDNLSQFIISNTLSGSVFVFPNNGVLQTNALPGNLPHWARLPTNTFLGTNPTAWISAPWRIQDRDSMAQIYFEPGGNIYIAGLVLTNAASLGTNAPSAGYALKSDGGTNLYYGPDEGGGGSYTNTTDSAGMVSPDGIGTNLSAANLTGTVPDARLSANVPLLNVHNSFTGGVTFNSSGNEKVGVTNGVLRLSIGSATTPSICFSNDTASGFFRPIGSSAYTDWWGFSSAGSWRVGFGPFAGISLGANIDNYFTRPGAGIFDFNVDRSGTASYGATVRVGDKSGANLAGGDLVLGAGKSTGSATGGSVRFVSSLAGGAGSSINTAVTNVTISPEGIITLSSNLHVGMTLSVGVFTNRAATLALGVTENGTLTTTSVPGGSGTAEYSADYFSGDTPLMVDCGNGLTNNVSIKVTNDFSLQVKNLDWPDKCTFTFIMDEEDTPLCTLTTPNYGTNCILFGSDITGWVLTTNFCYGIVKGVKGAGEGNVHAIGFVRGGAGSGTDAY